MMPVSQRRGAVRRPREGRRDSGRDDVGRPRASRSFGEILQGLIHQGTEVTDGEKNAAGGAVRRGFFGSVQNILPFLTEMVSEGFPPLFRPDILRHLSPGRMEAAHGNQPTRGDSPRFVEIHRQVGRRLASRGKIGE